MEFAYLKTAVRGRKVRQGSLGNRGVLAVGGALSVLNGVGGGRTEGKTLGGWVGTVEQVDPQRWEIQRKGIKGRGFLRIG